MTLDPTSPEKSPVLFCGALVTDAQGNVLLVQHTNGPNAGNWDLPMGAVRHLESLEAAIVQLLHLSFGILVLPHRVLSIAERMDANDGDHIVSIIYAARMLSRLPDRFGSSECVEGWYSTDALPGRMSQSALIAIGKGHRFNSSEKPAWTSIQ